jgi:glucosyl-3-phosphoglycerate synthase
VSRRRDAAGPLVVAVVAAWNEEATVAETVTTLRCVPGVDAVVVAADGCTDRTADEARAAGVRVLIRAGRAGKGGALEAAVARTPQAGIYLFVDADVGETAGAAAAILVPVLEDRLDLAIGRLPAQPGGGFGMVRQVAAGAVERLGGWRPEAPLSGQRAVRADVLRACLPLARGFGVEAAMTIDALRLGYRVGEVPVEMRHRATGRSVAGFAHRGRQGWDVLRAVAPRAVGIR